MPARPLSLLLLLTLGACRQAPEGAELSPMASGALPPTAAATAEHWWVCGKVPVSTQLRGEMLMLSGPFGERSLPPQSSASGARYADDKGTEFWSKGEDAMLRVDWQEMEPCRADTAAGAEPAAG